MHAVGSPAGEQFPGYGRLVHSTQVVVEIDVAILESHRMMDTPRNVDQLVAQRLQQR
jgi:hypothetical protein